MRRELRLRQIRNDSDEKRKHQALAFFLFFPPFIFFQISKGVKYGDVLMPPVWHQGENAASSVCMTVFFPGKFICPLPWLPLILVATSNLDSV